MPSREEIVGLLQEVADLAVSCQIDFKLSDRLKECAAQIENMRCKKCKHYSTICDDCIIYFVERQDDKFGCFSWEAKED